MLNLLGTASAHSHSPEGDFVPITSLEKAHVSAILKHLLELSPPDRYLRFGYIAQDEHIQHYVSGLNFERDEIYGIFNRNLEVVAMAHLAVMQAPGTESSCEFGVSVAAYARGRGYGTHLFDRAVIHARNQKVYEMHIHALSENAAMIRIASKGGATLERNGAETEAFVRLPKRNLDSRVSELLSDQYAKTNYHIKADAKRFWDFLATVQEIREGVRQARHKSAQ